MSATAQEEPTAKQAKGDLQYTNGMTGDGGEVVLREVSGCKAGASTCSRSGANARLPHAGFFLLLDADGVLWCRPARKTTSPACTRTTDTSTGCEGFRAVGDLLCLKPSPAVVEIRSVPLIERALLDVLRGGSYHGIVYPPFVKGSVVDNARKTFTLRDDDIIVATYPKCGTTWMQQIVLLLLHGAARSSCRWPACWMACTIQRAWARFGRSVSRVSCRRG